MEILELDARGLSHPEPLERSVQIFHELGSDRCFHLVIHRYPQPLIMIAQRHGLDIEVCEREAGEWHILFAKTGSADLKGLMRRYCDV
ncbi:DUF2249 domain-containing protein [Hydrogenimonas sp.]